MATQTTSNAATKIAEPGSPASPKWMIILGWVLTILPSLMLIMSAVMKLAKPPMVVEGFAKAGYSESVLVPLGIVELACTVLYLIPQTSVLGAILLTGYLGGATATHLSQQESFIAPVIFGVVVWFGIFLRDARLRALIPLRRT